MTTSHTGIIDATHVVATKPISHGGRRILYRGYLIHGEVPSIYYVIYGRNHFGQLTELGVARSFADAMRWVDRRLMEMDGVAPVSSEPTQRPATADGFRAAA